MLKFEPTPLSNPCRDFTPNIMAQLSLVIVPAKALADGTHKIRVRVSHKNQTTYIITRFTIDNDKQFRDGRVVARTDAVILNKKLSAIIAEYYDILDSIYTDSMTCKQLKEYLEGSVKKVNAHATVDNHFLDYIAELKSEGRNSTAQQYDITRRHFAAKFGTNQSLLMVTPNIISAFEKYCLKEAGLSITTLGIQMRHLKAVLNSAKRNCLVQWDIHPFEYYKIPTGNVRELDINAEDLRKIRDAQIESKSKEIARDMFMLSFYLGGINLIDLLAVDLSNNNTITYIRSKTKNTKTGEKSITLTIQPEARAIIDKYIGANGRLNLNYKYKYENLRNYLTKELVKLAADLEINKKVVFYSARKTVTQIGYELGISLETLEYTIGQSVKKNRPIFNYVRIMQKHADAAIRKILDHVN